MSVAPKIQAIIDYLHEINRRALYPGDGERIEFMANEENTRIEQVFGVRATKGKIVRFPLLSDNQTSVEREKILWGVMDGFWLEMNEAAYELVTHCRNGLEELRERLDKELVPLTKSPGEGVSDDKDDDKDDGKDGDNVKDDDEKKAESHSCDDKKAVKPERVGVVEPVATKDSKPGQNRQPQQEKQKKVVKRKKPRVK